MLFGRATCSILLACLALWPLSAASPVMPVSEVKPGMVGIGRTVFAGTTVEEFKAHILGVLENAMGPNRNLILARLEGGPLATTGVIAGMSGSPVSIDGRLVGAVSYSLGAFSREPIAGITPIDEMVDATRSTSRRPVGTRARAELSLPLSSASLAATLQQMFARTSPFAQSPADVRFAGAGTGRHERRRTRRDAQTHRHAAGDGWFPRRGRRPGLVRLCQQRLFADDHWRRLVEPGVTRGRLHGPAGTG